MGFSTVSRDIEQRINDNWISTKIAYENVPLNPKPDPTDSWIQVKVFDDVSTRITIGAGGTHRQTGTLVIEIYTPLNEGNRSAKDYGDTLAALFRDVQFNGLTFREANVITAGQQEGWFKVNMITSFFWDAQY